MRISLGVMILAASGCACLCAAAGIQACVVAPPPDLPQLPVRPPRILHESVAPPADVPLASWPSEFDIPVEVDSPIDAFEYETFVDFNAPTPGNPATGFVQGPIRVPVSPFMTDGGVMVLQVVIDSRNFDLSICHRIEVMVALAFAQLHTPGTPGADTITWQFEGSGAPYGCPAYDAGAYQNGYSAAPDSSNGLPVSPEAGARP